MVDEPGGRVDFVLRQQAQRVLTDQVVEDETARPDLAQHAGQRELGEHLACPPRVERGHADRSGSRDLRTGVGTQQRKGARCVLGQAPVRPREGGAEIELRAAGVERGKGRPFLGELPDQQVQGKVRVGRRASRDDREGKGEAATRPPQPDHGGAVVEDLARREPAAEELDDLLVVERLELDRPGVVEGGQARHPVAAGDDHPARAGSGEQGLDLSVVVGVVEHQQDPLLGQDAAQQA